MAQYYFQPGISGYRRANFSTTKYRISARIFIYCTIPDNVYANGNRARLFGVDAYDRRVIDSMLIQTRERVNNPIYQGC